jgi:hypothetical protein
LPAVAGPWPSGLHAAPRLQLDAVEQVGDDVLLTYGPQQGA